MTFREDLERSWNNIVENPHSIDITKPKTFVLIALIAILLGLFIGIGYWMVFNSQDCIAATGTCFPNPYAKHKLVVIAATIIIGVCGGAVLPVYRWVVRYYCEGDDIESN